jgi:hypothetical protein
LGYLQRIPQEAQIAIGAARSMAAGSAMDAVALPLSPSAIMHPHFLQAGNANQAIAQAGQF